MHIVYENKDQLNIKPLTFRKQPFTGFFLLKKTEVVFEGFYFEDGLHVSQIPKIYSHLDMDTMVLEENLVINDVGDAFLNNEPFTGTAVVEHNNQLRELATYKNDKMPLHITYDLNGNIEIFEREETETTPGIEFNFSDKKIKNIVFSDSERTLRLNYDNLGVCILNSKGTIDNDFLSLLDFEIKPFIKEQSQNITFKLSKSLLLTNTNDPIDLLKHFERHGFEKLTIKRTFLTLEKTINLIDLYKPKELIFLENALKTTEEKKILDFLHTQPNLKFSLDYSRLT